MPKRSPTRTRWRATWWWISSTRARGPSRRSASVKLSDTPGAVDRPAPRLGQDNADILTELGYTEAELRDLKAKGVI